MPEKYVPKGMSRASFLKLGLVGLSTLLAAACGGEQEDDDDEEEED